MLAVLNKILANLIDPQLVLQDLDLMAKSIENLAREQMSGLLSPADEPTPDNTVIANF